jgi:hypothetical protein
MNRNPSDREIRHPEGIVINQTPYSVTVNIQGSSMDSNWPTIRCAGKRSLNGYSGKKGVY